MSENESSSNSSSAKKIYRNVNKNLDVFPTDIDENVKSITILVSSFATGIGARANTNVKKNNDIKIIPPTIAKFTNLETFTFQNSQITTLPPEIGQLSGLTELHLSYNKLTTLPSEIGQLSALKKLYLEYNQLTTLPPEIGQLSALNTLYLKNNQLTTLPPEIGQLSALKTLYLENNQLTTLPPDIGQLSSLTELYLENNQLTTLPPEIGKMVNLSILDLEKNKLTTLPTEIENLINIYTLNLSKNNLNMTTFPILKNLYIKLKKFNEILLEGNKSLHYPDEEQKIMMAENDQNIVYVSITTHGYVLLNEHLLVKNKIRFDDLNINSLEMQRVCSISAVNHFFPEDAKKFDELIQSQFQTNVTCSKSSCSIKPDFIEKCKKIEGQDKNSDFLCRIAERNKFKVATPKEISSQATKKLARFNELRRKGLPSHISRKYTLKKKKYSPKSKGNLLDDLFALAPAPAPAPTPTPAKALSPIVEDESFTIFKDRFGKRYPSSKLISSVKGNKTISNKLFSVNAWDYFKETDDSINWKVFIYLKKKGNPLIQKFDITKYILSPSFQTKFFENELRYKVLKKKLIESIATKDNFKFTLEDILRYLSQTLKYKNIKIIDFTCGNLVRNKAGTEDYMRQYEDIKSTPAIQKRANTLERKFGGGKTYKKHNKMQKRKSMKIKKS